jgi:hypothetical protein
VLVDPTAGALTLTLPLANTLTNRAIYVTNSTSSTNTITVQTTSSQLINGQTSLAMSTAYMSVQIYSNGSAFFIL